MLTDEQLNDMGDALFHREWLHRNEVLIAQEAYRLGMLRAAEVCEELEAFSYDDPGGSAADAIRAEANAAKQQRS